MREQPQRLPVKKYFLVLSIGLLTVLPFTFVQGRDPLLEPVFVAQPLGSGSTSIPLAFATAIQGGGILHQYPLYAGCAEDVFRSNYRLRNLHIVEWPSD